jgi:hypothetical protein
MGIQLVNHLSTWNICCENVSTSYISTNIYEILVVFQVATHGHQLSTWNICCENVSTQVISLLIYMKS